MSGEANSARITGAKPCPEQRADLARNTIVNGSVQRVINSETTWLSNTELADAVKPSATFSRIGQDQIPTSAGMYSTAYTQLSSLARWFSESPDEFEYRACFSRAAAREFIELCGMESFSSNESPLARRSSVSSSCMSSA